MAMCDNKRYLLQKMRQDFVTSDSVCSQHIDVDLVHNPLYKTRMTLSSVYDEYVINSEFYDIRFANSPSRPVPSPPEASLPYSSSIFDNRFAKRYSRADSDELVESKKETQQNTTTVFKWQSPTKDKDSDLLQEIFQAKSTPLMKTKGVSALSLMLKNSENWKNPFSKYSQYNAGVHKGSRSKSFTIFLTMLPKEKIFREPLNVEIALSNKEPTIFKDLIGLICFLYTEYDLQPTLESNDINCYYLAIADDGDIEYELPPMDANMDIGRCNFPELALIFDKETFDKKKNETLEVHTEKNDVISRNPSIESSRARDDSGAVFCEYFENHRSHVYDNQIFCYQRKTKIKELVRLEISLEKFEVYPCQHGKRSITRFSPAAAIGNMKPIRIKPENIIAYIVSDAKVAERAHLQINYRKVVVKEKNRKKSDADEDNAFTTVLEDFVTKNRQFEVSVADLSKIVQQLDDIFHYCGRKFVTEITQPENNFGDDLICRIIPKHVL